ncbi:MAG: hypothetical protein JXR97_06455 [Planctomycetes bacterium]|nr:hypothetical protein [Planctomycetota bacterium]
MNDDLRRETTMILGAGPAGVGTALGLRLHNYGGRTVLVEEEATPGGLSGCFGWRGHHVDFGAHRLSHNVPEIVALARRIVGPELHEPKNSQGLYFADRVLRFPPHLAEWLSPALLARLTLFGCGFLFAHIKSSFSADPENFVGAIKRMFGETMAEKLVLPMTAKVWGNPEGFSADFARQRFTVASPVQIITRIFNSKKDMTPPTFFYPEKGFGEIWSRMCEWLELRGAELGFGDRPTKIVVENNRVRRVEFANREAIEEDGLELVSTIPLIELIPLLEGFEVDRQIEDAMAAVRVRSLHVGAFEFDTPGILPTKVVTFPDPAIPFTRIFEQNGFSRESVCEGKTVIVIERTVDKGGADDQRDDQTILDEMEKGLRQFSFMPMDKMSARTMQRKPYAYLVPEDRTTEAMQILNYRMGAITNLHLTGRFSDGEYDNCDYACEKGIFLGAMLSGKISEWDYILRLEANRGRVITG